MSRACELLRRLHEVLAGEAREQATVLVPAVEGEAADAGVAWPELLEARVAPARTVEHVAVVAREGLVAVLGKRRPQRAARQLRPAPLLAVPVPVAHEEVREPRAQQRPGVDGVAVARLEPLVELQVVDDLGGAHEARDGTLRRLRVLREHADGVLEVVPERAERGVVGHHDEPPGLARDPGRFEDPARDEIARRVLGRHQVVDDLRHDGRVLEQRVDVVEHVRGVLHEPAEAVAAPVGAREREHLGLLSAHAGHGRRPPASFARSSTSTLTGVIQTSR